MKKHFSSSYRPGFAPILVIGIIAAIVFVALVVFGPWELPGFGQLSQRQIDQAISAAEANSPTIPPNDSDQDGFSDEVEGWIRTDKADNCADNTNDAAWPPDFNNDKAVNMTDVDLLKAYFGQRVKGENNRRYDLNADKTINLSDVFLLRNFFDKGCPYYFLAVEPLNQSVSFKWQPSISELPVGLYGIDLTDTGKTQCSRPEDFVGGFAWTYDLKVGQTSYTGDSSSTGSFSIKFKSGHTYCAYLFKTGGGALSSYVTYTLPAPSPLPSSSPTSDNDNDGFVYKIEEYIGTDPNDNCPDGATDAAWPPDINNDKTVNTLDVGAFRSVFSSKVGDANYNRRYDLNADQVINLSDIYILRNYNGKSCTP